MQVRALLSAYGKDDLKDWLHTQVKRHNGRKSGYSSASIRSRFSTLKSLMSHAVRKGVIDHNPFDYMEKLEFTKDESTRQQDKRTFLTTPQKQAFLSSLNNFDEKLRAER